jgi:hypothetical protein
MKKAFNILPVGVLAALLLFTGCQPDTKEKQPLAYRISENGLAASGPALTRDHHGNIVLSWIQAIDSTERYLLQYATSEDGGNTFGPSRAIPATTGVQAHDENLSRILFKENGDIMAMFAVSSPNPDNPYAGLVFYTQSFDGGKRWTPARQLSPDTVNSIDERYFDMALLPDGEIGVVWLDARKETEKEGSSLYYASTRGRGGFQGEKAIDTKLCQCCRTDLYVDGQQQLHVAYRGILNDSIRDMMHLVSLDNGRSFSSPERISADNWVIRGCPHTGPAMTSNQNGLHYAWYTMGGGSGVFYSQQPTGKPFTPKVAVSDISSARHPQITTLGKGKLAIVWDERVQQGAAFSSRIGAQLRDEKGNFMRNFPLTPDTIMAVYPVLVPITDTRLLVAYTDKSKQVNAVWYKLVSVE